MRNRKIQYMAFMAMFLAIEVVLVLTPLGYVPIGPLNLTTMHIPVVVAGVVLGKKAGAQMGFVFGLTSLLNNTFRPTITSFCFSPFITIGGVSGNFSSILIALIPRILLGFLAGLVFEQLRKFKMNENLSAIIAGVIGAVVNTVLVLGMIYIFFGPQYAAATGHEYATLIAVLLGVIATNGILEAILAGVVTVVVNKAVAPIARKVRIK